MLGWAGLKAVVTSNRQPITAGEYESFLALYSVESEEEELARIQASLKPRG